MTTAQQALLTELEPVVEANLKKPTSRDGEALESARLRSVEPGPRLRPLGR